MIDLAQLGFTKEELQQRVVDQICENLLTSTFSDEDGEPVIRRSSIAEGLEEAVKKSIDAKINDLAEKHVLPNVANYVENLCLQETNKWGEKLGQKVTFIEYLVKRAEAYLSEQVNHDGKSKSEENYSWTGKQSRITYLVHQHLQYSIENAMKDALKVANSSIASGIQETVKLKLSEISNSLQVSVKTK